MVGERDEAVHEKTIVSPLTCAPKPAGGVGGAVQVPDEVESCTSLERPLVAVPFSDRTRT